jgi:hypothetical protein
MRHSFIQLMLFALITSCTTTPARPTTPDTPMAPPQEQADAPKSQQPMPLFEIQHNWIIVETDGVDAETVAVVTLARPELAGLMRLEIMPSYGMTPREYAAIVRARVDALDGMTTNDPRGPDTDDTAGFIWVSGSTDAAEGRTIGHIVIRRMPDNAGRVAFCEGWWPETSDDFLTSPLMNACVSVRSPPWTKK